MTAAQNPLISSHRRFSIRQAECLQKSVLARASITAVLIALLSACSFFEPHKIAIQQGNLVSAKALSKVELGMNKNQVSYLLGTPLAVDTFDPDYWVYGYSVRKDTELLTDQRVKLRFNDNKLTSIEAEGLKLPAALTGEDATATSTSGPTGS